MTRSLLVTCLIAAPACAQIVSPFGLRADVPMTGPFDKAPIPAALVVSGGVAIADVDGDGRGDVLASAALASNATATGFQYYRNRGDGTFDDRSVTHVAAGPTGVTRFVVVDFDGDADPDVVTTYNVLRNVQGVLTPQTLPTTTSNRVCVAAGDVDGDGDVDVFFGVGFGGGPSRQDQLLLNQGGGAFAFAPPGSLPPDNDNTQAAVFFDADGDGDLDLGLGIEEEAAGTGGARLYRNDGTGTFAHAAASLAVPPQNVLGVAPADFDGDGDQDVVLGTGSDAGVGRADLFLRNDGTGQFTIAANVLPGVLGTTTHVAPSDLDNDGDADLLLATGRLEREQQRVYRNDGATFTDVTASWLPAGVQRGTAWATGALDADGHVDAVFVSGHEFFLRTGRVQLFLGRGGTTFLPLNARRCADEAWRNATDGDGSFADVDGDGDLDWFSPTALRGTFGVADQALLRNDGRARFTSASAALPAVADVVAGRLADVDGDGDPDVLLATATGVVQWRNDGTGNFGTAPAGSMPAGIGGLSDLCVGDLDADGDVDVFAGRASGTVDELLSNDGSGGFTRLLGAMPTRGNGSVRSSVALDHDGDGDLDLVVSVGFSSGTLTEYRNVGGGQFQLATGVVPPVPQVTRVQVFDADGDGDADLVASKFSGFELLRDQGAAFVAGLPAGLQTLSTSASNPNLFDFEGDGDVDLTAQVSGEWRLARNDGAFVFREAPDRLLEHTVGSRFAGADLDGDGDADFVVSQVSRDVDVMLGRRVQLDAPCLARVGMPYALELHLVESVVGRLESAVFALNFARLTPALAVPPLGSWHVDPVGALLAMGAPETSPDAVLPRGLRMSWVVPNVPALLGATSYGQALVIARDHVGFTNLVADVVR